MKTEPPSAPCTPFTPSPPKTSPSVSCNFPCSEDASYLLNLLIDAIVDMAYPVVETYAALLQSFEERVRGVQGSDSRVPGWRPMPLCCRALRSRFFRAGSWVQGQCVATYAALLQSLGERVREVQGQGPGFVEGD